MIRTKRAIQIGKNKKRYIIKGKARAKKNNIQNINKAEIKLPRVIIDRIKKTIFMISFMKILVFEFKVVMLIIILEKKPK